MNLLLDTNYIYNLLVKSAFDHKYCIDVFKSFSSTDNILIPVVVFAELAVGEKYVEGLLDGVKKLNYQIIPHTQADFDFIEQMDPHLRWVLKAADCQILAACHKERAMLVSLDRKLLKFAAEVGVGSFL